MSQVSIKKDVLKLREKWRTRPEYSCFWSSPDNVRGLQLTPVIEPGRLYVDLKIEKFHSGFPGIANGGVPFTILDGLMSWYLISHHGRAGFTKDCSLEYRRPLHVGKTYRFEVNASPEESGNSKLVPLVGNVFSIKEKQIGSDSLQIMKAMFFLANRKTAQQVLEFNLGEDGDELFPED